MPLIDDQTRTSDRRVTARWPWVLVIAGLAGLWVLIALAISFVPRTFMRTTPQVAPAQTVVTDALRSAEQMAGYGAWAQAAGQIEWVPKDFPLSTMDKHTYFRIGGQAHAKSGSPLAGAEYHERYLSWSTQIHQPECRSCHGGTSSIPPVRLGDMRRSELGTRYTAALTSAKALRSKRDDLKAELKRKPEDPRLHLLLYHLERALKDSKASQKHADWLGSYTPP